MGLGVVGKHEIDVVKRRAQLRYIVSVEHQQPGEGEDRRLPLSSPTLVTTKDAGNAVTLLQSLSSSTFDNSQLVLTACMGYQVVTEARLRESRHKHMPLVRSVIEERSKGLNAWKDTQELAYKLYTLKQDHVTVKSESSATELSGMQRNGDAPLLESEYADMEFFGSIKGDLVVDSVADLKEHVNTSFDL
ncbi:hypothetical protein Scep_023605 [Stephania cephalantha]|uniref:Uncharacterized protein n=1 Tax=Stephania cephalantha TaxID=152367 RepID=A0AAP0EXQ8_9MAGN